MTVYRPPIAMAAIVLSFTIVWPAATRAQSDCAGRWRVSVEKRAGNCTNPDESRIVIVSRDGGITLQKPSRHFELTGRVQSCKVVVFDITRDGEMAEGTGQVSGRTARGTWVVKRPADKNCSGIWFAERR